ncbi:hypothetical protein EM69_004889, partial [Salmonella enterica subsp. enterica serovar Typhimurium]|nr:hypothetical protein [Salmonella enterica subsp. enterica serovar Typhimurium]
MSRNLMPKSGAMAPYVVVNRDAAVAGVFSVDGEAGAVVLTSKYLQISKYTADKAVTDASITSINESIGNINTALGGINTSLNSKAAKGANNDITELNALTKAITIAQGGTGANSVEGAKINLGIERFKQTAAETMMYAPGSPYRITARPNGEWGYWRDDNGSWIPLPIAAGGTGGNTPTQVRTNLELTEWGLLPSMSGKYPGGFNFDNLVVNSTFTVPPTPGSNITGVRPFQQVAGLDDGWFYLETLVHPDTGYTMQRATQMTGAWAGSVSIRVKQGGTWSVWKQASANFGLLATPVGNRATFRSSGTATGGSGCLVGGQISGGSFTSWRDRPCGVLVEHETTDAAYAI